MPAPKLTASDKAIVEATAAAIGGVASTVVFYPLDTAKTRYQASVDSSKAESNGETKQVATRSKPGPIELMWLVGQNEGVAALYRGLSVKIAHTCGQTFLYFYAYSFLKRIYESKIGDLGTISNLSIGVLAGCFNILFTQPLDTLSTIMQMPQPQALPASERDSSDKASSSGSTEKQLKATGAAINILSMYKGLGASMMLTTNPAIQYTVFEQMRRWLLGVSGGGAADAVSLSSLSAFVLGAAAKSVATAITYPMIRSKVMIQTDKIEKSNPSLLQAACEIVEKEGGAGLYKGLQAQLLKTVLAAALMLAIKEKSFAYALSLMIYLRKDKKVAPKQIAR